MWASLGEEEGKEKEEEEEEEEQEQYCPILAPLGWHPHQALGTPGHGNAGN